MNQRLSAKPSGCVIWMIYNPATLEIGPFFWFGGEPGKPLPNLGERAARHTKGNAQGLKAERQRHRQVSRSRFVLARDPGVLLDLLFGAGGNRTDLLTRDDQISLLVRHLAASTDVEAEGWVSHVRDGEFSAIPADLAWDASCELAHLIDGYAVAAEAGWGDPFAYAERRLADATRTGIWAGGPAELWTSLFLEHRRWRMAAIEPHDDARRVLDSLCQTLRVSLSDPRTDVRRPVKD